MSEAKLGSGGWDLSRLGKLAESGAVPGMASPPQLEPLRCFNRQEGPELLSVFLERENSANHKARGETLLGYLAKESQAPASGLAAQHLEQACRIAPRLGVAQLLLETETEASSSAQSESYTPAPGASPLLGDAIFPRRSQLRNLEALYRLSELKPLRAYAALRLIRLLREQGEWERARAILEQALSVLDSAPLEALSWLAETAAAATSSAPVGRLTSPSLEHNRFKQIAPLSPRRLSENFSATPLSQTPVEERPLSEALVDEQRASFWLLSLEALASKDEERLWSLWSRSAPPALRLLLAEFSLAQAISAGQTPRPLEVCLEPWSQSLANDEKEPELRAMAERLLSLQALLEGRYQDALACALSRQARLRTEAVSEEAQSLPEAAAFAPMELSLLQALHQGSGLAESLRGPAGPDLWAQLGYELCQSAQSPGFRSCLADLVKQASVPARLLESLLLLDELKEEDLSEDELAQLKRALQALLAPSSLVMLVLGRALEARRALQAAAQAYEAAFTSPQARLSLAALRGYLRCQRQLASPISLTDTPNELGAQSELVGGRLDAAALAQLTQALQHLEQQSSEQELPALQAQRLELLANCEPELQAEAWLDWLAQAQIPDNFRAAALALSLGLAYRHRQLEVGRRALAALAQLGSGPYARLGRSLQLLDGLLSAEGLHFELWAQLERELPGDPSLPWLLLCSPESYRGQGLELEAEQGLLQEFGAQLRPVWAIYAEQAGQLERAEALLEAESEHGQASAVLLDLLRRRLGRLEALSAERMDQAHQAESLEEKLELFAELRVLEQAWGTSRGHALLLEQNASLFRLATAPEPAAPAPPAADPLQATEGAPPTEDSAPQELGDAPLSRVATPSPELSLELELWEKSVRTGELRRLEPSKLPAKLSRLLSSLSPRECWGWLRLEAHSAVLRGDLTQARAWLRLRTELAAHQAEAQAPLWAQRLELECLRLQGDPEERLQALERLRPTELWSQELGKELGFLLLKAATKAKAKPQAESKAQLEHLLATLHSDFTVELLRGHVCSEEAEAREQQLLALAAATQAPRTRQELLRWVAESARTRGEASRALQLYDELLQADPADSELEEAKLSLLLSELGSSWQEPGSSFEEGSRPWELAESLLPLLQKKAASCQLEETRKKTLVFAASLQVARGEGSAALQTLDQLLSAHSSDPEVYRRHAELARELEQAELEYRSLLAWAASTEGQAEQSAVLLRMAELDRQHFGRLDRALALYERLRQLLPNQLETEQAIADISRELGLYERAAQAQTKLIELAPSAQAKRDATLALARLHLEQAPDGNLALAILERARLAWPLDGAVLQAQLDLLEQLGQARARKLLLTECEQKLRSSLTHSWHQAEVWELLATIAGFQAEELKEQACRELAQLLGGQPLESGRRGLGSEAHRWELEAPLAGPHLSSDAREFLRLLGPHFDAAASVDLAEAGALGPLARSGGLQFAPPGLQELEAEAFTLANELQELAQQLELPPPELFLAPGYGAKFELVSGRPLRFLCGPGFLELSPRARTYLLHRSLKLCKLGVGVLARQTPASAQALYGAALSLFHPLFVPAEVSALQLAQAKVLLEQSLSRAGYPDQLPALAERLLSHPWAGATLREESLRLAERTALLATSELETALELALGHSLGTSAEERHEQLAQSAAARDLLLFWGSESCALLRTHAPSRLGERPGC